MPLNESFRLHEDLPLFREAVNFTAARTSFAARLVEKDYFCTLLLAHLRPVLAGGAVFKGGTCLAKVLIGFYRLSEDLDFAIPQAADAPRRQRSQAAEAAKAAVRQLHSSVPAFRLIQPLRGANNSTQYVGSIEYDSPTTDQPETIHLEFSLREPLLTSPLNGLARTVLLDPVTEQPMIPELPLPCISPLEAIAEKFRAALTRREAAIRDLYDLDYAVCSLGVDIHQSDLITLVRRKLAIPGNDRVNVSPNRLAEFSRQVQTRLRPVIRQQDFEMFDLDRAFEVVASMARLVAPDE